ncbi:MAG: response regulator [Pyrinomonadaceae bacterium]|nr:response regulator [Blastocatellia bacterium]MCW5955609.1 response regulator [Pyrinomonadaceae bacterium]
MKTILIADDSPSIRRLLENTIKSAGYRVLTASDGREALKIAFENSIDAIIADEEMPNLTGSDLFKILKTDPEKKNIPLIMISGLTVENDKPVSELADVFLSKNADLRSQVLTTLERVV